METDFEILNCDNTFADSVTIKNKIVELQRHFGGNYQKLEFQPCKEIFKLYSDFDENLDHKRKTYVLDRERSN